MHARRSAIRVLRGVALCLGVAALLAVGPVGALSGDSGATAGTERAVADSFRVQLYATTERAAAESFRTKVRDWWARMGPEAPEGVFGASPPLTVEHEGAYYRVRIGAFDTRAQARRAQSFLRRQYPDAFIVEETPPAQATTAPADEPSDEPPPPTPETTGPDGPFQVQLYATTERVAAESFRSEARRWWRGAEEEAPGDVFGADPPLSIAHEGQYHRVRMGAFATRATAQRARDFLQREYPEAFVVQTAPARQPTAEEETEDRTAPPPTTETTPQPERRTGEDAGPSSEGRLSARAVWAQVRETVRLVEDVSRDTVYTRRNVAELFDVGCSAILPEQARANALAVESTHLNRQLGLDLEARYGQESPTVGTAGSPGGLSGTYVGLDWSLLSQGLLGNRMRSDLLEARSRAERLTAELARIQRTETCRARRVQERMRGMVPRLLEAKIELGRAQQRLLRQAYLEGEALLDTYLNAKGDVREAERRLTILRDSVHRGEDPPPLSAFPPLVDLDFEALARADVGDSLRHRLGEVERRAIDLEDDAAFDTRLSVFSRYSTNRTFQNRDIEFGVRLSQPLFGWLLGNDERAEAERMELRRREERLALSEHRENLRTVHRRFEEDQSVAIRAHYRVSSRRERLRQQLGARSVRANDRLNEALQDAADLLQATIEKVLAYGEVYEEVARAFDAAREPFNPSLLSIHPVARYEGRGRVGRRSLYVWSEEFRRRSNNFIIELAQARKIGRLIVSAGHNTPMNRVRALQEQARKNGIATELLLAANHWVEPGGVERARTRISNLELRGSALHLDVEPHALNDFDQREDEYLQRYLEVLRVARRTIGPENELVVSVPLFWPDRVYQEIATIVDRAHLMAYGEKETRERASQALDAARHFAPEQRVVALRPEDFTDPWDLDQAISTLQTVVQADRFALHDLASFLEFIRDQP